MKRVKIILSIIWLIIANACDSEQVAFSNQLPFTCSIQSRSENTSLSLIDGSQILVNAQGGLEIENEIFTYNGNIWESGNDYQWTHIKDETRITALYPIYHDNNYTLDNLYSNGELEDVLLAQKTYPEKSDITLLFKHLFSSLTINIEENLLESIKDIQLTIPVKVNYIDTQEGTFSIIEDTHIITRNNNGETNYSFIIPPSEACVLTLTLIMKDNTIHEHNLNSHTFQSGMQYECHVVHANQRPGIRNAEQLIAFSQLINGKYKESKYTLADFGEEVNGQMVYRLLADITLTEEECNLLEPIGDHESIPFSDTFDGEEHTITNLTFKAYGGYGGLFGKTSETATIKNLNINNGSGPLKIGDYKSGGIGFIVGRNNGTISNCHVTNSTISNEECIYIGGITGYTQGKIINCSVSNTTIESPNGSLGAITGYLNTGSVLNSYSSNNTTSEKVSHNGGICGFAQNGTVTNCYIHSNQNVKGQIIGTGNNHTTVIYCYCDQGPVIYSYNKEDCYIDMNYKYNDNFIATATNTPIYQALNQWIDTQTTYTDTFIQWKADTTLPAVFTTQ